MVIPSGKEFPFLFGIMHVNNQCTKLIHEVSVQAVGWPCNSVPVTLAGTGNQVISLLRTVVQILPLTRHMIPGSRLFCTSILVNKFIILIWKIFIELWWFRSAPNSLLQSSEETCFLSYLIFLLSKRYLGSWMGADHQKDQGMFRSLELSALHSVFHEGERGWKLSEWSIDHVYVMNPP